jgi:arabinogalactan oligomer/maltooligosaccharide transport system substrate-binding protein
MKKLVAIVLCLLLVLTMVFAVACEGAAAEKTIMLWGPAEHRDLYLKYAEEFRLANADALKGYKFDFAGSGDAGAYAAMAIDPTKGAAVYSFPNDQMANLLNLGALSPVFGDNLAWSEQNNIESAVEATYMGGESRAYPLQADNGYFMYYNRDAFVDTSIWDAQTDDLKDGYTFRDMYKALDEKGGAWKDSVVIWPFGDSWYVSGVFFSVGGDYSVTYNAEGKQTGADCSFAFTGDMNNYKDPNNDYSVGMAAVEALINTTNSELGSIVPNKHFKYADGDKSPSFDLIVSYSDSNNDVAKATPLAAGMSGTWHAASLQKNWGDNYRATKLPMLEDNAGNKYAMKTFAGYKLMGVNPLCEFATSGEGNENVVLLHKLAQYLTEKETQIERYGVTGAGPSNKEALEDPTIAADIALLALNSQYDRECVYPAGSGKSGPVGNGLGFRVQDSVPANYWTPIQNFAAKLWLELETGALNEFSAGQIKKTLAQLQVDIAMASQ